MLTPKLLRAFGVFSVLLLVAAAVVRADDEERIARAREVFKLLTDGKYEEFVNTGTDTVKAAFSAEMAQGVWAQIQFQLGEYQSIESAKLIERGGYHSVDFACRFERGTCTLRVTLDDADRMAGFHQLGLELDGPYEPAEYVNREAFREEKVTVSAGEFPLAGTLAIPNGAGPHPGLVLVHGSGPNDEDETVGANKPFRDLAWGLASRGVATLRYVKRTKAHPFAKPAGEWTLEDETIDDALAAAKLMREHGEVDAQRVFVLGHSLGGIAAPFMAARDKKLAGIIVAAGTARPILDVIEDQITYLAKLNGDLSDEDQAKIDELKAAIATIRAGKPEDVKEPLLGVPAKYWAYLDKLDQTGTAAKLKLPILILQGGRDYQVTRDDYRLWKTILRGRKNVTFKLFPKLNHLFITGEGPSGPTEYQQAGHVDAAVIEYVAKWIGSR